MCNNTLRARLDYAIQQALPQLRSNLFPTPQAPNQPQNVQKMPSQPQT